MRWPKGIFLQVRDSIRDYFVTGKWKGDEDANELLRMNDLDDDEMFGDFEDLEAGIVVKGNETEDTATGNSSKILDLLHHRNLPLVRHFKFFRET